VKQRFQPKFNIKKGDSVVVIAGDDKDRSKPRKVIAVYPQKSRVLIEGVNMVTKHKKPSAQNPQGGIVQEEAAIHISNVMLWDAKTNGPVRIKRERKEGGFVRISKKSGEEVK
jgi:large subunit ribosomal protein L24